MGGSSAPHKSTTWTSGSKTALKEDPGRRTSLTTGALERLSTSSLALTLKARVAGEGSCVAQPLNCRVKNTEHGTWKRFLLRLMAFRQHSLTTNGSLMAKRTGTKTRSYWLPTRHCSRGKKHP